MKIGMVLILVYVSAILVACNKGADAALEISPEKQGVDVPLDLQGNWVSAKCDYWGGGGDDQYSGYQYFTIKGSSFESFVKEYNNGKCEGAERSILKFKMKLEMAGEVAAGVYNLDVVPLAVTKIVFDQDTANLLNTTAYCGYTDWLVNVEKNISDRDCMSGVKINQMIYTMVRVTNTTIQLGEEDKAKINDGSTPEKRHSVLGQTFNKQN